MEPAVAREQFNSVIANAPDDFTLTESRRLKLQAKLAKILMQKGYVNDRSTQKVQPDSSAAETGA